ncbi:MAG TPA: hypothetical protein VFB02_24375 [Bradyrhizobium sp.]|nr:hypothetical protein [Bradyrhizobium sp.]
MMKMYYRLEPELDYFLIRHVETDREVGHAFCTQLIRADGSTYDLCTVYNNRYVNLARVPSTMLKFPIRCAAVAAASHQAYYDFPDLKGAVWNAHSDRVERRLGALLADTAWAFARACCEATGQGLTAETKEKFGTSLAELAALWGVSRVGSLNYNAGRGTEEPYFANPLPSGPRLTFSGAAQVYGMRELRARYPNISDAERQKLLGWVLQWLSDALSNERREQEKEREREVAEMLDRQKRYASTKVRKTRKRHS